MLGIKYVIKLFLVIFLVVSVFSDCRGQKINKLYILFELKENKMMIMKEKESTHYAFFFSKSYYWGFEPTGLSKFILKSEIHHEIVNFDWLDQKYKFQSQLILKCPDIFVVEKIGKDTLKITPVRVFEAIE